MPQTEHHPGDLEARVDAVRAFNRFWTARIGVLGASHLDTKWSLTEARVLFELAQRESSELSDLRRDLGLDAGYLSRIVARFKASGLATTAPSAAGARRQVARLTPKGRRAFETLNARSIDQVTAMLGRLGGDDQRALVASMNRVRRLLDDRPRAPSALVLRGPRPGDLGWVVERHGALYADEHGWDDRFEGLVASVVGEYVEKRDPRHDAAWIATMDGERAGSIFCVRKSAKVAKLRLLLVEPRFRGRGIGSRLVDECVRFARSAGYSTMTLWTNDVLRDARKLYERAGFVLVKEEKHRKFGPALTGQTWELDLAQRARGAAIASPRSSSLVPRRA